MLLLYNISFGNFNYSWTFSKNVLPSGPQQIQKNNMGHQYFKWLSCYLTEILFLHKLNDPNVGINNPHQLYLGFIRNSYATVLYYFLLSS
jgi:hypothetical protein